MPTQRRSRSRRLKKDDPTWPPKYYRGLSKAKATQRRKEILKFGKLSWRDPRAYVGFKTNVGVKTRKSSYTVAFRKLFPDARSLAAKSRVTGVPEVFLRQS